MTEQAERAARPPEELAPGVEGDSVRATFERLVASGRAFIEAELEWARIKTAIVAGGVRNAALFGILAIIFFFAGLSTLLVGGVIALAPLVGAVLATVIVGGGAVLIAALLGLAARSAIMRIFAKGDE